MKNKGVYVIAEAGVNHNGSEKMAFELIDVAKECGANAVKFQTFKTEALVTKSAPKSGYQVQTTGGAQSQFDMLKALELSAETHHRLVEHCKKRDIQFISAPFDMESVRFLIHELKIPILKIPSGEITNAPLLLEAGKARIPVILSTGLTMLADIERALGILAYGGIGAKERPSLDGFVAAYMSNEGQAYLKEFVTVLHCTSEYPTPFEDVNLRAMETLKLAFGLPYGLSDHTEGIAAPIAAVALGATLIEKHFTLDKTLPGPDHPASLNPAELRMMIASIHQVEKAMGRSLKIPAPSELKNKVPARKSLVAKTAIKKGELFSEENMTIKRPAGGIEPVHFWQWVGKPAGKDYQPDTVISE